MALEFHFNTNPTNNFVLCPISFCGVINMKDNVVYKNKLKEDKKGTSQLDVPRTKILSICNQKFFRS